ncbi:hypothetical protein AMS68_000648 [Peltaster fructicola]|uniref:PPPDE domain-containing protein n=1 Tax=Peltaster fructicola TaxID=286661 RepID=A0A6H0XKH1_9PEZI|nr:hypothetical protein AMS68_000648 [Peltaster fructicola]
MDVQLYVYDLTRGMARNMSRQLLGIQIDAVYHTAIVFGGIEYFFGAGVQTCYAGSTHHGRPMETIPLGVCNLPMDVVMEYLESLKAIYTPESYDLFAHNCNNFSNDFATFLVGKGIPDHITNLPQQVLNTPFGQMLKPQLDASMRSITQAPVPQQSVPKPAAQPIVAAEGLAVSKAQRRYGSVVNVTAAQVLDKHLAGAKDTCATIFFTSSTCAPCKLAYPTFDSLADEQPQALFVKVDINDAHEIASKWNIRATPTFTTLALGKVIDVWSGADPAQLKSNVEKVLEQVFPPHAHTKADAAKLKFGSLKPTTYAKVPPLDKLIAKLGDAGRDASVSSLKTFVEKRQVNAKEAALPQLASVGQTYRSMLLQLPVEVRFAAVDLLRCAMIDQRVSGYFAEEPAQQTIGAVMEQTNAQAEKCPHNLRLVTIHLVCNCFSSHLFVREVFQQDSGLMQSIVQLVTSSLLDNAHSTTRVAAASLAFNVAAANYRIRREESHEGISESAQVELAASILECIPKEDNDEASKGLLLSLGYLLYFADEKGELMDLCIALDAKVTLLSCKQNTAVAREIAGLL